MLTRSGLGAMVAAVIGVVLGWWFRYEEIVVISAAVAAAVLAALASTRMVTAIDIRRRVATPRVARGEEIRLGYRVTNPGRRRSTRLELVDQCDDRTMRVSVAPIASGELADVTGAIPSRRRGVFDLGPCRVERSDLFGLTIGRRNIDLGAAIIVHPRVHALDGPYGAMHSTDDDASVRTATADPLNGFVSLREYVDGDDPRLIHWPTSARMGTLMLRETVEMRRPEFTVVVDTAETSTPDDDDFEEVVDVAASLAVDALGSGIDVRLRTTDRERLGPTRGVRHDTQVLDFLTRVGRTENSGTAALGELFQRGGADGRVVIVTGPDGPSSMFAEVDRATLVRVGSSAIATFGIHIAATDATDFARRWRS